jgi:hypothetical protein
LRRSNKPSGVANATPKFWPLKGGRSCHSFPPRQPTIAVRRPAYTVHSAPNQSGHFSENSTTGCALRPAVLRPRRGLGDRRRAQGDGAELNGAQGARTSALVDGRDQHEHLLEAVQQRLDKNPQAMRVRREIAEHPFGRLKMRMGATRFLMKTLPRVATEMAPHVLAYNLTRVMNILGIQPLMAAMKA